MDIRKYGKPPKKTKQTAEQVLGMVKKVKKKKKVKKPVKSKKDNPKKGRPKSILSKTLKRATTTDQSIYNNTQQQFLQDLHGRLNSTDGRANGLWNSYKRNLTAQSFGGTPYEMLRMREEADILRERLERSTNGGRRRQPQQQATAPPPTTPPTTPPPQIQSHLGAGTAFPARGAIQSPQPIPAGGDILGSTAMGSYVKESVEGTPPSNSRRGFIAGWDDQSEDSDGNYGVSFKDDFTPAQKEEKKAYDQREKQMRVLGDVQGGLPYMPANDWKYDPSTEPSGPYGGGSDDDDDEGPIDDPLSSSTGVANSNAYDEEEKDDRLSDDEIYEPEDEMDDIDEETDDDPPDERDYASDSDE